MSTPSVNTSSERTSTADHHALIILAETAMKMPAMVQKAEANAVKAAADAEVVASAQILISLNKSPDYCQAFWKTVSGPSTNKESPPKNANGRTPLRSSRPAATSNTATKWSGASQNTPQAPSEEAAEPALKQDADKNNKEKWQCLCSKCKLRSETGQLVSQTTHIEHERAEKRQNEGRPADVKCARCIKIGTDCMVDGIGKSCAECTWVKEKCCRDGATSQRRRSGGDGKCQKKSGKVPVVDAVVPKQAKRKASEPMEGPKKAQKLADGGRHTFTEAHVKAEPKEPSVSPNTVKETDGGNNMPVVGASRGDPQNDTKKKKRNGWTTVN